MGRRDDGKEVPGKVTHELGMMVNTCNPSTLQAGRLEVHQFEVNMRYTTPSQMNEKEKEKEGVVQGGKGGEPRIHSEYQVKDLDLELKRGKTQARLENSAYAARTQGTQPSSNINCKGTVVTYGKGLQQ